MTPADPKTEGISPKAYLPFAALILAGVVLLILGEEDLALAVFAAAAGQGGIAYAAKPGKVRPAVEPPPEPPQLIVT
jgi:hypothetical protein